MSNKEEESCVEEELEATLEQEAELLEEETETSASVEAEMMKWRDVAMRTAAEYDNYRKRMAKDKEEILKYANQRLFEELLPVIDNYEMGMMAASSDTSSMIYVGMSMVKKQLDEFLSSNGVTSLEPKIGDMFDVKTQDALQSEVSEEAPGTILRVVRKGYSLKDRLLRPANVVVSAQAEEPVAESDQVDA